MSSSETFEIGDWVIWDKESYGFNHRWIQTHGNGPFMIIMKAKDPSHCYHIKDLIDELDDIWHVSWFKKDEALTFIGGGKIND